MCVSTVCVLYVSSQRRKRVALYIMCVYIHTCCVQWLASGRYANPIYLTCWKGNISKANQQTQKTQKSERHGGSVARRSQKLILLGSMHLLLCHCFDQPSWRHEKRTHICGALTVNHHRTQRHISLNRHIARQLRVYISTAMDVQHTRWWVLLHTTQPIPAPPSSYQVIFIHQLTSQFPHHLFKKVCVTRHWCSPIGPK